jgi:hypothetical protein
MSVGPNDSLRILDRRDAHYSGLAVSNIDCQFKESCAQKVVRGMGVASTGQDQTDLDQLSRQIGLVA